MLVIYGNLFFWDMMIDHKKKMEGWIGFPKIFDGENLRKPWFLVKIG